MNTHNNVDVVRRAYKSFEVRDAGPLLAALSDSIVWHDPLPNTHPIGGTFTGIDAVRRYFAALSEAAEIRAFETVDIIGQGMKVVAFMHLETTIRSTGKDFVGDSAHLWTFGDDGLATNYRIYADTAGILAAYSAR